MTGVVVKIEDLRTLGYCASGAREMAKRHGLDWMAFMRGEVTTDQLEHINDAMMADLIKTAKQRAAQNGQH